MSNSVFQSVIVQLRDISDRVFGVIDTEGCVISCTDMSMLGERWTDAALKVGNASESIVTFAQKSFKAIMGNSNYFEYAVFCNGDDDLARSFCQLAFVALNDAKTFYEEKHDRGSFIKDIISDNIMLGDIYMRAKELRVTADVPRGVFVVRSLKKGESVPTDVVQSLFPDRQNDFVLSIGEGDVVLIHQMPEGSGIKELNKIAASIEESLRSTDAFVALTESSETNILTCVAAKKCGIARTIAEVENLEYIRLAEDMGVDAVINKKLITAGRIFKFTLSDKIRFIKYMSGTNAEVLEYITAPGSKMISQATRS